MVRSLVVLSLFVAGCFSRTEADSCTEKVYSGGVLRDCGDIVEFEPTEPKASAYVTWSPSYSHRARVDGVGIVFGCSSLEVPEGLWIICPDGLSRLERHDATARDAGESGGALAELGEKLLGLGSELRNRFGRPRGASTDANTEGEQACESLGNAIESVVKGWYPRPEEGVRPADVEWLSEHQPTVRWSCQPEELSLDVELPWLGSDDAWAVLEDIIEGLRRRGAGPEKHGVAIAMNLTNTSHKVGYPGDCRWYGYAVDNSANNMNHDRGLGDFLAYDFVARLKASSQDWRNSLAWACSGQDLTLQVQQPSKNSPDAAGAALEELLKVFRRQGLEPRKDGVSVLLDFYGEVAYFDPGYNAVLSPRARRSDLDELMQAPWQTYSIFEWGRQQSVRPHDTELTPGRAEEFAEGCIGFCFDAIIKAVDKENPRIARVVIIEEDGTKMRAVVHRSRVSKRSRAPAREGMPLRFACFDRFDDAGRAPRFEDCVQMTAAHQENRRAVTPQTHRCGEDDSLTSGLPASP